MEILANPWMSLAVMAVLFLAAVIVTCALLKTWKDEWECDKERAVEGKLQAEGEAATKTRRLSEAREALLCLRESSEKKASLAAMKFYALQESLSQASVAKSNAILESDVMAARMEELQSKLQEKTEANGRLHLKYLAAQERVELLEKEAKAPQLGRLGELVSLIGEWGEARSIPAHSTAYAQSLKTQEELDELKKALVEDDRSEAIDAIGDIFVTLVMVCACQGWCLKTCVELAYAEIKDRTGHLNKDGVFVKDDCDT